MPSQVGISANTETIRRIQLEMLEIDNMEAEEENDFEGFICRQDTIKERIRKNEGSSVDLTQIENHKES